MLSEVLIRAMHETVSPNTISHERAEYTKYVLYILKV